MVCPASNSHGLSLSPSYGLPCPVILRVHVLCPCEPVSISSFSSRTYYNTCIDPPCITTAYSIIYPVSPFHA